LKRQHVTAAAERREPLRKEDVAVASSAATLVTVESAIGTFQGVDHIALERLHGRERVRFPRSSIRRTFTPPSASSGNFANHAWTWGVALWASKSACLAKIS
jgi:hypothetical protein